MDLQRLYSYARQAIDDYQMIEPQDHIAVGISGGKDSLILLYALYGLRRFYPAPFHLTAVTVDLGYRPFDTARIRSLCDELHISYRVITTEIASILRAKQSEEQVHAPCSLCARLRKGALNQVAIENGCNKIAYAHHMDDMVETALLSLFFEGRFYSFPPRTALSRTGLTVIRPLMYVPEADIRGLQKKLRLPVIKNPCPVDGSTKRAGVKALLRQLNREYPGIKKRIFHAICNGGFPDWPALSAKCNDPSYGNV